MAEFIEVIPKDAYKDMKEVADILKQMSVHEKRLNELGFRVEVKYIND